MSHRFFADVSAADSPTEILLDERESRHALLVFRIKPGEKVDLYDGRGRHFVGTAGESVSGRLRVRVDGISETLFPSPVPVVLGVSLFRSDRMEILVQKACELGAQAIAPFVSERSIIKLDTDRWFSKEKRWQKIIQESCKQCGLSFWPEIFPLVKYQDMLKSFDGYDLVLIPTLEKRTQTLVETLSGAKPRRILVLIGPEGDFSAKEVEAAMQAGAKPVSLGPLVLRSETAAMYALSTIHFYYREVGHDKK